MAYASAAIGKDDIDESLIVEKPGAAEARTYDNMDVMIILSGGTKFYIPAPSVGTKERSIFSTQSPESQTAFLNTREEILQNLAQALSAKKLGYKISILVRGALIRDTKIEDKNPITDIAKDAIETGSLTQKRYQVIQTILESIDDQLWTDEISGIKTHNNEFGLALFIQLGGAVGAYKKADGIFTGLLISYAYNIEKKALIFDIMPEVRRIDEANTILVNALVKAQLLSYQGLRRDQNNIPLVKKDVRYFFDASKVFLGSFFPDGRDFLNQVFKNNGQLYDRTVRQYSLMNVFETKIYPAFIMISVLPTDYFRGTVYSVADFIKSFFTFAKQNNKSNLMCERIFVI